VDYLKLYHSIINRALQTKRSGYFEMHHIVPRSVYGEGLFDDINLKDVNDELNLAYLTAREHFIVHWLLHRAYPKNRKLGLAFWAMTGWVSPDHQRDYTPSSRTFEEARTAAVNAKKIPILQYDLEGNFMSEFKSLNDASDTIGVVPNSIGQNLSSATKSSGGFQWRFKTKNYSKKIDPYSVNNNGLPVGKYSLKGVLIEHYESLLDAERKTGHSEGSIRASMNRGSKVKGTSYFFIQFNKYQKIPEKVSPFEIPLHAFSIPVVQISADGKYFIAEFQSVTHAAKYLGKNTGHISSACKGIRKTAYGFAWKYKRDYNLDLPIINFNEVKLKLHSKSIAQYNLKGEYIRSFKSASEAARFIGGIQPNISSAARGKRNHSEGYQWAYIENGIIAKMNPVSMADNTPKKVIKMDKHTHDIIEEFDSVGLAAKAVNGSQSNISACINGRKKTAYGYKWSFKLKAINIS